MARRTHFNDSQPWTRWRRFDMASRRTELSRRRVRRSEEIETIEKTWTPRLDRRIERRMDALEGQGEKRSAAGQPV